MAEEEKKEVKKEEKLTEVKIIARGEKMALVQYFEDGMPVRVSVPLREVKDYKVSQSALGRGVPYGIPYETLEFPKVTAKDIAAIMRNYNLWTPDDIRLHAKELQSAFSEIYSATLQTIFQYIKGK